MDRAYDSAETSPGDSGRQFHRPEGSGRAVPATSVEPDAVGGPMKGESSDVIRDERADPTVNSPKSVESDGGAPAAEGVPSTEGESDSRPGIEAVGRGAGESAIGDADIAPRDPATVESVRSSPSRVSWTRPAEPVTEEIAEGIYRGRNVVGDVGQMLRIEPVGLSKSSAVHVPDSVVDAGRISDAVSIGVVSIKGASHHLSGVPRQDAYFMAANNSWLVIGIADGVSQGKLSHLAAAEAAKVSVRSALRELENCNPADVQWSDVGSTAQAAVRRLGQAQAQRQVGEGGEAPTLPDRTIAKIMATTADLLIVPATDHPEELTVWHVRLAGDSSLYVIDPDRGWGVLSAGKDESSEMVDNSVAGPLPIGGATPELKTWTLEPSQAIVLCTDGFGGVIDSGARPVGRYLYAHWQKPLDTTRLLATASFLNINADDDRTAAIVWATS